jgi:hypothetical protein
MPKVNLDWNLIANVALAVLVVELVGKITGWW